MARRRGRPVIGAIAGFLTGLLISLDLVLFGVVPTNAQVLVLFPPLGLVLGILVGLTGAFGRFRRRRGKPDDADDESPALAESEAS